MKGVGKMLTILEQEYYDADVEYEVWECDENGMPLTLVSTFTHLWDAEREVLGIYEEDVK
jgi:hypothetical protein